MGTSNARNLLSETSYPTSQEQGSHLRKIGMQSHPCPFDTIVVIPETLVNYLLIYCAIDTSFTSTMDVPGYDAAFTYCQT